MKFELKERDWTMELGELSQEKAEIVAEAVFAEHKTGLHRNSAVVRAAIEAEWLIEPEMTIEEVGEVKPPSRIGWIADNIATHYIELVSIPKN